jgi:hypothetical protein
MKSIFAGGAVALALLLFTASDASAYELNDAVDIFGYGQIWLLLSEEAGREAATDGAATTATGFKDKRLRFGVRGKLLEGMAFYRVMVEGAGGPVRMLDYYFGLEAAGLGFQVGRFRPYVTWEASVVSSASLKNIERDAGLRNVTAAFFMNNALWRDNGVQLNLGDLEKSPLALVVGVTNGTGADTAVGGDVSSDDIYANGAGDVAYTIGLAARSGRHLRFNLGYALNKHTGARTAGAAEGVDIDRTVYSAGFAYEGMEGLFWIDGEYARFTAGGNDVAYADAELTAYYGRLGFFLAPNRLEFVARYALAADRGIHEGTPGHEHQTVETTATVNYYIGSTWKSQIEYTTFAPDGHDSHNAVRAMFQLAF